MCFRVVFIDDNLSDTEPFVRNISKHYKDADYSGVFKNPDEGLKYVLDNLSERMIVFIDWNFGANQKKGIELLREIRSQTSLLYVVMMSANQIEGNIPSESIIEMINDDNIFYLDRSNSGFKTVENIIDKIQRAWSTKFDCILEQWLIRHPEDNDKEAFTSDRVYTWNEVLPELRRQSDVGKSFEKLLNEYYIHLFSHLKK